MLTLGGLEQMTAILQMTFSNRSCWNFLILIHFSLDIVFEGPFDVLDSVNLNQCWCSLLMYMYISRSRRVYYPLDIDISMGKHKTAVTPLPMHWSYHSLVLNHQYMIIMLWLCIYIKLRLIDFISLNQRNTSVWSMSWRKKQNIATRRTSSRSRRRSRSRWARSARPTAWRNWTMTLWSRKRSRRPPRQSRHPRSSAVTWSMTTSRGYFCSTTAPASERTTVDQTHLVS